MKSFKMKSLIAVVLCLMMGAACLTEAMACTAIYVGADLTEDGSAMFARSEDLTNSYNKVFYVSPAGNHKAGDVYSGCYGFTYTFKKDSYSYTAFCDDIGAAVEGVCPDCGGTHIHTPYEAAGTNEMGVSISATETLYLSDQAVGAVDPYEDAGIEEAEIVTLVLSEAATAKEAVDLLTGIYDTAGCNTGAGIFIGDHNEIWYIENVTGHQYVAVKLSASMAFVQPNQSVIGLIDLDDAENVIASPNLIAVAKAAGTYVGNEEENTIDYVASYNPAQKASSRMIKGLKHLSAEAADAPDFNDYTISNVGVDGQIVPFYSKAKTDGVYSVKDVISYFAIEEIGKTGNLEIHIFQIAAEDSLTDTVEWVAMDDGCYNVFVPYYPMLTLDTYAAYQVSTPQAAFAEEAPEGAVAYAATARKVVNGERVTVEGFKVLPEEWAASYYWTFDALSNVLEYNNKTDAQKAQVKEKMAALQEMCFATYDQMKTEVAAAPDAAAAAVIATKLSMDAAEMVHKAAVEMVNALK